MVGLIDRETHEMLQREITNIAYRNMLKLMILLLMTLDNTLCRV